MSRRGSGIHIEGYKELQRMFEELPKRLEEKAVKSGLAAVSRYMAAEARKQVSASTLSPNGKKIYRRAIKPGRGRKLSRQGQVVGSVIITSGHKYQAREVKGKMQESADAWWWPMVEWGTRDRKQRKTGRHTGKMEAQGILKKAFDASVKRAISVGSERMQRDAQREIDKLKAPK